MGMRDLSKMMKMRKTRRSTHSRTHSHRDRGTRERRTERARATHTRGGEAMGEAEAAPGAGRGRGAGEQARPGRATHAPHERLSARARGRDGRQTTRTSNRKNVSCRQKHTNYTNKSIPAPPSSPVRGELTHTFCGVIPPTPASQHPLCCVSVCTPWRDKCMHILFVLCARAASSGTD